MKKEEEEVQVPEQRFVQPVSKTMVRQFGLCSTWRSTVEHLPTLQPVEDPTLDEVDMP